MVEPAVSAPVVPGPSGLPAHLAGLNRPLVWGVLNVTPDSFSDGGLWLAADAAVEHGLALVAGGADVIDVGGESTRPGAVRVDAATELARVLPVVRALADQGAVVSIDTMRAEVAVAAVEAGAAIVNDVSGGLADPQMAPSLAGLEVPVVLMHWRGHSATMADLAVYGDVVADVVRELEARVASAVAAGVARERLVVDPGLGFAKEPAHNWALLARLDAVAALGLPVLVGASRKRFLGELLPDDEGGPRPASGRDAATDAVSALAAAAGVWAVRVHDVRASRDAVAVGAAWRGAAASGEPR